MTLLTNCFLSLWGDNYPDRGSCWAHICARPTRYTVIPAGNAGIQGQGGWASPRSLPCDWVPAFPAGTTCCNSLPNYSKTYPRKPRKGGGDFSYRLLLPRGQFAVVGASPAPCRDGQILSSCWAGLESLVIVRIPLLWGTSYRLSAIRVPKNLGGLLPARLPPPFRAS